MGEERAPSLMWFRRDLRLSDHPALARAVDEGGPVLGLVVLDPHLHESGGRRSQRYLASVRELHRTSGGTLVVRTGRPEDVVPRLAAEVGAGSVHVTQDTAPYGRRRDQRVGAALHEAGVPFLATGSPYAVTPGRIRSASGSPYQVFTPFRSAWLGHGWRAPAQLAGAVPWLDAVDSEDLPPASDEPAGPTDGERAGEQAALRRWGAFLQDGLAGYRDTRDRPDLDATSRMSVPLKYGEIHPRTLLADIARHPAGSSAGAKTFVSELCWREFYADVLWHRPASAWHDLRPELSLLEYDDGPQTRERVEAWRAGRTGYPFVDAGMRQLREQGWMHNRVRMATASFLVKDLHVWWPVGARHFLDLLRDGDLASNNHGWQWVAGTGTDAAPYHRVFNPVRQGLRFDPDGHYVRRWVPELSQLRGADAHEPWRHPDGYAAGYPERIVDHDTERRETLARYAAARDARRSRQ